MKKICFCLLSAFVLLAGCASSGIKDNQVNIYELLSKKSQEKYSAWLYPGDKKSMTMYYSDKENYKDLVEIKDAMGTGAYHFIYYKNKTEFENLHSIMILGYYFGDPNKEFKYYVEDMKGNTLYESPKHTYGEFPRITDTMRFMEFVVDLKKAPRDLIIKLAVNAERGNCLYIVTIPNKTNVYSFEYIGPTRYGEYRGANFAIFPTFD